MAVMANILSSFAYLPGTPLRLLSLMAIEAVVRIRSLRLTSDQRQAIIQAMEIGAQLNEYFDNKQSRKSGMGSTFYEVGNSGVGRVINLYVQRLKSLECSRPSPVDDSQQIIMYRENVNRLSLAVLWSIATDISLDHAYFKIKHDIDLNILFRIVMLIQIVDDILDYRKDQQLNLPSLCNMRTSVKQQELQMLALNYLSFSPLCSGSHSALNLAHYCVGVCARLLIWVFLVTQRSIRKNPIQPLFQELNIRDF